MSVTATLPAHLAHLPAHLHQHVPTHVSAPTMEPPFHTTMAGFHLDDAYLRSAHHDAQFLYEQDLLHEHMIPSPPSGAWAMSPQKLGRPGMPKPKDGELSKNNIYISGLKSTTTDDDLKMLCGGYGSIVSAKAIVDRESNFCKGYGFVMFDNDNSARVAVDDLMRRGVQAAFAKVPRTPMDQQQKIETDPTNLYITNLPRDMDEPLLVATLIQAAGPYGEVISCRVLRDEAGVSRGVGLARMNSRETCDNVIKNLNGKVILGCTDQIRVKHANGPSPRKPTTTLKPNMPMPHIFQVSQPQQQQQQPHLQQLVQPQMVHQQQQQAGGMHSLPFMSSTASLASSASGSSPTTSPRSSSISFDPIMDAFNLTDAEYQLYQARNTVSSAAPSASARPATAAYKPQSTVAGPAYDLLGGNSSAVGAPVHRPVPAIGRSSGQFVTPAPQHIVHAQQQQQRHYALQPQTQAQVQAQAQGYTSRLAMWSTREEQQQQQQQQSLFPDSDGSIFVPRGHYQQQQQQQPQLLQQRFAPAAPVEHQGYDHMAYRSERLVPAQQSAFPGYSQFSGISEQKPFSLYP